ncbi:MAG: hypothetical protein BJ554DRAFT_223 [Olpidium bornovanus]|uniref:Uncharacterized protein n=1 Tax=Olpidium bornovanus TaxID=278681 RepID=A0A8H7ZUH7_9FUNG|nr:MAG: hypothetical protein BJ554DRAFT_223 [Olpidium bornovanus]
MAAVKRPEHPLPGSPVAGTSQHTRAPSHRHFISTKEDPETLFELLDHIATGNLAAVKVIKLEPGEELDEVLNEVNFLKSCSHSNIVSYVGCYMKRNPQAKGQKNIWVGCSTCDSPMEDCREA